MKLIAKILLFMLSIPIFLLLTLSASIRFQLLSTNFWTTTFESGNVYQKLSSFLSSQLDENVLKSGGNLSDVGFLSDLISQDSVKKFVDENIDSFLTYANGKTPELLIYLPLSIDSFVKNPNIESVSDLSQKVPATEVIKEFNIQGISQSDIVTFSKFGYYSTLLFSALLFLYLLLIFLAYLLSTVDKRLISPALFLLIPGILLIAASFILKSSLASLGPTSQGELNIGLAIASYILPPLTHNLIKLWIGFGVSATFLGLILFFVKKPVINKTK